MSLNFVNTLRLPLTAIAASVLALLLSACATMSTAPDQPARTAKLAAAPTPAAASSAPGMAAPTATAVARPAPQSGAPAPFAEVTRGAKRSDGYLPLWTRDDKTWIEIPAAQLDQPMFLGTSTAGGIGIAPFWPGLMGREQLTEAGKDDTDSLRRNLQREHMRRLATLTEALKAPLVKQGV